MILLKRALDNAEERKAVENEQVSLSECHAEFFEYRSVLFTGKPATEASDEKWYAESVQDCAMAGFQTQERKLDMLK